jgi:transcriptional regulator with XRE-family HTH domain
MTQQQLAKRVGSKQKNISQLENGGSNPTVDTLCKIAHAFDCELTISFIPRNTLDNIVENLATDKAEELVKQSIANAAMELQKPNKKIIQKSKEDLKNELISKKRTLLW